MDCKLSSIKSRAPGCRGLSTVELLVGLSLSLLVGLAVVSMSATSSESLACLANSVDMQTGSRHALDILSRDIRQSQVLLEYAPERLVLLDPEGQQIIFQYSPEQRTFARIRGGIRSLLLSECDRLQFALYKRSPKTGTLAHDTLSDPTAAKVVSVSWACSRTVLGAKLTTDVVDGARIVMRKD